MGSKQDRVTARTAIRRWGISDKLKDELVEKLEMALEMADKPREVASIGKLLKDLEGQNQSDDHLREKQERADDGKADQIVEVVVRRENQIGDR